jgi:lipoprotein-releasing system ATP-binding protein
MKQVFLILTTNIFQESLHELFFKLREVNQQTFIIVTHNNKLADLADKKITIKDGKID